MKTTPNTCLWILSLLTLSACEMTVDLDLPDRDPQIVVNSYFGPGHDWEVDVSTSSTIKRPNSGGVLADGELTLYKENEFAGTFTRKDGRYHLTGNSPEAGKVYSLRVEAPGYAPVEAYEAVPRPVTVANLHITPSTREIQGDMKTEVRIVIQDEPDANNFYSLNLTSLIRPFEGSEPSPNNVPFISTDHSLAQYYEELDFFGNQDGFTWYYGEVFFSDELFRGREKTITIFISDHLIKSEGTESAEVVIRQITEAYFRYEITSAIQARTGNNPFAEPVSVYSNVSNGMGIFGAYNESRLPLK